MRIVKASEIGKEAVEKLLTKAAFDRHRCYGECLRNEEFHKDKGWADVCGQCAIFVPCSFRAPGQGA